jgi:hypothetical protein
MTGASVRSPVFVKSIAILSALLILLTACGGDNTSNSLDEDMAVDEILRNASERLAETDAMHFRMDVEGETRIDAAGALRLLNAEGDMARPNKVNVQFQVKALGQTASIRMITIGEESWTTDLITGKWVTAPEEFGYNPAILYDNQDGLGPVMGKIANPEMVGIEEIDGKQVYHVHGTASKEVMTPLTSGTMQGDEIGLDLWIDGENWDLLRVVVKEPAGPGVDDPATWTMILTDHNKQIDIEAPA